MSTTGNALSTLNQVNVKDVIVEGLKLKIEEQGNLRLAFDVTTEYPTRETFQNDKEGQRRHVRRIVVKKLNTVASNFGIGWVVDGEMDFNDEDVPEEDLIQGWVDSSIIEISVWSPDSRDRDNIVELIKLWMLELEQDVRLGNLFTHVPFYFDRGIFAIKYLRDYEDVNYELRKEDGPMYIGSLVFEVMTPFFHRASTDDYEKYKLNLIGRIVDCINIEANIQEE